MKKNTVILGLDEFEKLRKAQESLQSRNAIFLSKSFINGRKVDYLLVEYEEADSILIKENKELRSEIDLLKEKNEALRLREMKFDVFIYELENMTFWQKLKNLFK
ncbi:MAG: hypothetical protein ACOC2F_00365 [Bacteroidota bacterium]